MRRFLFLGLAVLPLLATACDTSRGGFSAAPAGSPVSLAVPTTAISRPAPSSAAAPRPLLVLRVGQGSQADALVSVDAVTGGLGARLPIGVPDRAWSTLYATSSGTGAGITVIRALDVLTGAELRRTELPGDWALPSIVPGGLPDGLAEAADRLILVDRANTATTSRFAFVSTTFGGKPQIVTLSGAFEFDAVGPDGRYVFLIEHEGKGHYQVRAYDVQAGRLADGPIVDKREIGEQMEGRPVARTTAQDGAWAFTVYVRDDGTAFVHQLDTVNAGALCVDLPHNIRGVTSTDSSAWKIVATSGTNAGIVLNDRLRFLASMSLGDLTDTSRLTVDSALGLAPAPGGRAYLLEPTVLTVYDGALNVIGHGPAIEALGLAASVSGDLVYLLSRGGHVARFRMANWLTPDGSFDLDPAVDWSGAAIVGVAAV